MKRRYSEETQSSSPEENNVFYVPRRDNRLGIQHIRTSTGVVRQEISVCLKCGKHFQGRSGGSITNHLRKCFEDEGNEDVVNESTSDTIPDKKEALLECFADYCILSGCSFRSMESWQFKRLVHRIVGIYNPSYPKDKLDREFPSRVSIRDKADSTADKAIERVYKQIRPEIIKGKVTIILDHGRFLYDYLSVYGSYLNSGQNLEVVPLAFHQCASKTAEGTADVLDELAKKIGVSIDEMSSNTICADGASSMIKLGSDHFATYIKCVNHMIYNISSAMLSPRNYVTSHLTDDDKIELKDFQELFTKVKEVVSAIRNSGKIRMYLMNIGLPIPHGYVETRWLVALRVIKSLQNVLPHLLSYPLLSPILQEKTLTLLNSSNQLNAMIHCLQRFEVHNVLFQSTKTSLLHQVGPMLYKELEYFNLNKKRDVLHKCIALSLEHHIDKYLSTFHAVAHFLDPRKADDAVPLLFREKGKKEVIQLTQRPKQVLLYESIVEELHDNRCQPASICRGGSSPCSIDVHLFWKDHITSLPALYLLYEKVFGCVPSESICESQFSKAANVLTRHRMSLNPDFVGKIMVAAEAII